MATTEQTLTALAHIGKGAIEVTLDPEVYRPSAVRQFTDTPPPHVRVNLIGEHGIRITAIDTNLPRVAIGEALNVLLGLAIRQRQ